MKQHKPFDLAHYPRPELEHMIDALITLLDTILANNRGPLVPENTSERKSDRRTGAAPGLTNNQPATFDAVIPALPDDPAARALAAAASRLWRRLSPCPETPRAESSFEETSPGCPGPTLPPSLFPPEDDALRATPPY